MTSTELIALYPRETFRVRPTTGMGRAVVFKPLAQSRDGVPRVGKQPKYHESVHRKPGFQFSGVAAPNIPAVLDQRSCFAFGIPRYVGDKFCWSIPLPYDARLNAAIPADQMRRATDSVKLNSWTLNDEIRYTVGDEIWPSETMLTITPQLFSTLTAKLYELHQEDMFRRAA